MSDIIVALEARRRFQLVDQIEAAKWPAAGAHRHSRKLLLALNSSEARRSFALSAEGERANGQKLAGIKRGDGGERLLSPAK